MNDKNKLIKKLADFFSQKNVRVKESDNWCKITIFTADSCPYRPKKPCSLYCKDPFCKGINTQIDWIYTMRGIKYRHIYERVKGEIEKFVDDEGRKQYIIEIKFI